MNECSFISGAMSMRLWERSCDRLLDTGDTPPAQFCPDSFVFVADLRAPH